MTSLQALAVLRLLATNAIPIVLALVIRWTAERAWPAVTPQRFWGEINYLTYGLLFIATIAFAPVLNALTVLLTNHLGGGFIVLPSEGLGLVLSFFVFAVTADLGEYLFHRAEHAIPMLWSMHSLHHSDTEMDASTSFLHYWMIGILHSVTIGVALGLVFKVPSLDLLLWAIISNHVFLMHANLPWDFGRLSWLITSPRYHRVHHSSRPEHFDSNFASILPIWDVLFGTQCKEWRADDNAPVGLGESYKAQSLFDLAFWPVRDQVRKWRQRSARSTI